MFDFVNLPTPQPRSHYIRTTWMVSSDEIELKLSDSSRIRLFSETEAQNLAILMRKRNVFIRHSYEQSFYLQRINAFANHTVIEIVFDGYPKEADERANKRANLIERLAILSASLVLKRNELHQKLGISSNLKTEIDFSWEPGLQYFSSKMRAARPISGVRVDEQFCRRFSKCGFEKLYDYCLSQGSMSERVNLSLSWLFEARQEPNLMASVVKTSIALESLLIFNESEALARALSERVAFILSSLPSARNEISRIVKRFYEVRSGIVHGSRKKVSKLSPELVEAIDRFCILLYLTIASNSELWASKQDLQNWCESERWGNPTINIQPTSLRRYVNNAIKLGQL